MNSYDFLFDAKMDPDEMAEHLGTQNAQVMNTMFCKLEPKRICGKNGLMREFMNSMDELDFDYSRQEHSPTFVAWVLHRYSFHTTERGVVLRENSGLFGFGHTIIAEIFKYPELLEPGTPEYEMAKAIDTAGRRIRDRKYERYEYRSRFPLIRTRRNTKLRRRYSRSRKHRKATI
jgi:hypothetical protein